MNRLMANPVVVLREEFDDWAVLFNPDSGKAVGVNPTGVAVWKRLDGRHTLEEIVAEIAQLFSNPPETIQADVERFAQQLLEGGFAGQITTETA